MKVVLIATYPPRRCGIATFAQDLLQGIRLIAPVTDIEVFALDNAKLETHAYPPEVTNLINQDEPDSYLAAAAEINAKDAGTVVIVQHEYGIYGGRHGRYLLPLLQTIKHPIITTMHTVLESPSKEMRDITAKLIDASDKLVVLTNNSCRIIKRLYPSAGPKIELVEHGIHPSLFRDQSKAKPQVKLTNRKILLTFGLLSRNKGIEYAIQAMPGIAKQFPDALYLIVGGTHPSVLLEEGEAYRLELMKLADELHVQDNIRFISDYLPLPKILAYLQAADIYISSSLDPEQVVSGTLSYALGAGCAVIASGFSQAKESVRPEIGRLVPMRDALSIEQNAVDLLGSPQMLNNMRRAAYAATRSMLWSNVADDYMALAYNLTDAKVHNLYRWPTIKLDHLQAMTDDFGLFQFSSGRRPLRGSGYTLDDNSRALMFCHDLAELKPEFSNPSKVLSKRYLGLMAACLNTRPMINYLSDRSRKPTRQNLNEDLADSQARAFYALSTVSDSKLVKSGQVQKLLKKIKPDSNSPTIRPVAFYLMGTCNQAQSDKRALGMVGKLANRLVEEYQNNSSSDWRWFEEKMTYANGIICASLLESARLTGSKLFRRIGLESVDFLINTCFMGDIYVPIGQKGWYKKGGSRAMFDQQPEDALATIQALESAFKLTHKRDYLDKLEKCFSWFLGNNLMGLRIYDDKSGGCHDGLRSIGANRNEGAESTLAYLQSRLIAERCLSS